MERQLVSVGILHALKSFPSVRSSRLQDRTGGQRVVFGRSCRWTAQKQELSVPSGTSLFFPLINAEFSDLEQFGNTDRELRSQAQSAGNLILTDANKLFATLDGVPILNLAQYRVESPLFNFGPLPPNNMITYFCVQQGEGCPAAPAGAKGISVADGVYLMLSPLSPGTHTLRFHAELDLSQFNAPNFKQDITYHLTVTP